VGAGAWGTARWGPDTVPGGGIKWFKPFPNSNGSKIFIFSKFYQFKNDFPELQKFEIEYSCEGFDERNDFL
jgi:hypothetical protein